MKQRKIRIIIIVSIIVLYLIANLYYFLVKSNGLLLPLSGLLQLISGLTALIALIILVIHMVRKPEYRNALNYLTIIAVIIVITALRIPALRANENTFQSPVKIRACYEGTMNTSRLFLRENGTFEDFNIGFFGVVYHIKGKWTQTGDTISLQFDGNKSRLLDNKIIIKEGSLYKINADTLFPTHYYLGHCKGLN